MGSREVIIYGKRQIYFHFLHCDTTQLRSKNLIVLTTIQPGLC